MDLESDIATYLAQKDCGVLGKTIFVLEMPSGCDEGILLLGSYSGTPVDHNLPDYYVTEFRLIVRGTDYVSSGALMAKATAALQTHGGFTTGTTLVRQCLPANLPRRYRRSLAGYWEYEVDMEIVYVDQTA
jgi:hypothetical protein